MVRVRAAMRGRIPITTLPCFCATWTTAARELYRLADIGTEVLYSGGGVINAMAYDVGAYRDRTPLMLEIRRDGIDL